MFAVQTSGMHCACVHTKCRHALRMRSHELESDARFCYKSPPPPPHSLPATQGKPHVVYIVPGKKFCEAMESWLITYALARSFTSPVAPRILTPTLAHSWLLLFKLSLYTGARPDDGPFFFSRSSVKYLYCGSIKGQQDKNTALTFILKYRQRLGVVSNYRTFLKIRTTFGSGWVG